MNELHSHAFNEISEGLIQKGKVIVDAVHKDLFSNYEIYDKFHIVVSVDEFKKNGGVFRFVAIRKYE